MKHSFLIIFLVSIGHFADAQHASPASREYKDSRGHRVINDFPDSIRIEFSDLTSLVIFELQDFHQDNSFLYSFSSTLLELHGYLEKSMSARSGKSSVSIQIVYRPDGQKKITIHDAPDQTQVLVQGLAIIQLLPPGIEVNIQTPSARVYLYIPQLSTLPELARQDFVALARDLQEEGRSYYTGRKSIKAHYIVQAGKTAYKKIQYAQPNDVIYLTASAGVGVFRDKVYPELSGSLGLHFSNRFNRKNRRVELTYSAMYLPERTTKGTYRNNISSFAGASYSKNFHKTGDRPVWTGVGAAWLVHESGDYFKGKTLKMYIHSDIGSTKLNLVPEFYLTEDFQKFQFGLKLNYTF